MDEQLKRLEAITNRLESVVSQFLFNNINDQSQTDDDSLNNSPVLRDYDTLINESVKPFLTVSRKIGGDLATINDHVSRLFDTQKEFLRQVVQSKKPNEQQIMEAIRPQSSEIEAITS